MARGDPVDVSDLIKRDLSHYVTKLRKRESFGLARYGDGEWLTIFGKYGQTNSNGCTFTKELAEDLIHGIRKEHEYDYSILRIAYRKMRTVIETWLEKRNVEIKWILGDFLLAAHIDGELYPLIEQLRHRKILYVGPEYCRELEKEFFAIAAFVEPPPTNAHLEKTRIEQEIFTALDHQDIDFIGFSSGLAGKVFMSDIWEYTDGEVPFLDFGSSWDGYFGVQSRSYIRRGRLDFDALRNQNTQGVSL